MGVELALFLSYATYMGRSMWQNRHLYVGQLKCLLLLTLGLKFLRVMAEMVYLLWGDDHV